MFELEVIWIIPDKGQFDNIVSFKIIVVNYIVK